MTEVVRRSLPLRFLLAALASFSCQNTAPEPAARPAGPAPAPAATPPPVEDRDPSFRSPAPERLVAIGDVHGDLAAFRRALHLAGAVDDDDRWIGGKLVVVQTGDEIDRGDDDRKVIELVDRLKDEAEAKGGRFIAIIGNHEAMNVNSDFRYVTKAGFTSFDDLGTSNAPPGLLQQFPVEQRSRVGAFAPGGPFARRLAERDTVVMVGSTVFVHGGVTADHVRAGIGKLNRDMKRWMSGQGPMPELARLPDGPLWTRRYSDDAVGIDCAAATQALTALGAKRMVVGHTPQSGGITNACDGRVWRIDTGLSSFYGGPIQVLEIRGETVAVLRAPR